MAAAVPALASTTSADRLLALKQFVDSKAGVRGLVDSGITSLPSIFIHPNLDLSSSSTSRLSLPLPTVDLSLPRSAAVDQIRSAAGSMGFFHVINHGIPPPVVDRAISAFRSFNELPYEARSKHYSSQFLGGFSYAASWRDWILIQLAPARPDPDQIPEICREELMRVEKHMAAVGREVLGMLLEGLGVEMGRLDSCPSRMTCNYYPWCPEPERTMGMAAHMDPVLVTVLAQDAVGGLQIKWNGEGGESGWLDVAPVPEALVVNIGDLLQIISNDEYKSVEHRVIANPHKEARVSIAVFLNPEKRGESDYYGPLPELVSQEKPAIYRNFTVIEFIDSIFSEGRAGRSLPDYFRL